MRTHPRPEPRAITNPLHNPRDICRAIQLTQLLRHANRCIHHGLIIRNHVLVLVLLALLQRVRRPPKQRLPQRRADPLQKREDARGTGGGGGGGRAGGVNGAGGAVEEEVEEFEAEWVAELGETQLEGGDGGDVLFGVGDHFGEEVGEGGAGEESGLRAVEVAGVDALGGWGRGVGEGAHGGWVSGVQSSGRGSIV